VPVQWPSLADTISCLRDAQAQVVLAHPHRYKLSSGALRQLVAEFADCGGHALEISIGGMSANDRDRIATMARRHSLAGSGGSDFHDPAVPWNPPGRFAKLPADIELIATRLVAPGNPATATQTAPQTAPEIAIAP
jgi:predicted metal-dependent phosphoesterase TrpH